MRAPNGAFCVPPILPVCRRSVHFDPPNACVSHFSVKTLAGTVEAVNKGAVNGHVTLKLADGNTIKGSITNEVIDELGLVEGTAALAIVKSTDVIVGVE